MKSVKGIRECYGCGVCVSACTKKAINIRLNTEGFYVPSVDASICNECGICIDVCAYSHEDLSLHNEVLKSYGAWSNNKNVRERCSSGGVGYELGKHLLNEGYKVSAVRYNPSLQRA